MSESDPLRLVPPGVARRLIAAERPGVAEWMDGLERCTDSHRERHGCAIGVDRASGERTVYDDTRKVWVTESRIAENRARPKAAEWLSALNAMEVA